MNWTNVIIEITPADQLAIEAICGILYQTNVGGIEISDPTLPENRNTYAWDVLDEEVAAKYARDKATISVYYSPQENIENVLLQINEGLHTAAQFTPLGQVRISHTTVQEEDWENNWKQYYKPVRVGKNFLIKPVWEEVQTDKTVIELDPGMAFGTGTHETTRMCLALMEQYVKEGGSFLDIGCGSGILAIGAKKLGADRVVGVDIDQNAVKIAGQNAQLNHAQDIVFLNGDLTRQVSGTYDVVMANIIADAVIALSADAKDFMTPDGVYITSGIINLRRDDVMDTLISLGFEILQEIQEGEWVAIACKK